MNDKVKKIVIGVICLIIVIAFFVFRGKKTVSGLSGNKELTYAQKKALADRYLGNKCGLGWDDLSDINSLHDATDLTEIKDLCDERLSEEGYDSLFD